MAELELVAQLRECLEGSPDVIFALLFGSRANGRPRPNSDVDVADYLDEGLTPRERFRRRLRLIADLDHARGGRVEIDLTVLNDVPALLAHRALMGTLLFARHRPAYVEFFVRTIGASEDERYFHEIYHQANLRRLAEGSFEGSRVGRGVAIEE